MRVYRLVEGRDFDAVSGEISHNSATTRLEPQPAALLALLASRPGEIITHEEIKHVIWGHDTHVDFKDGTVISRLTTRRRLALACAAAVLAATVGLVERRPNDHHQMAVAVLKAVHDFIF